MGFKRRDGFIGQRMIALPDRILKNVIKNNPVLAPLYITQIGYFPKASLHYRERRTGCADNILFYCLQGKGWYVMEDQRYEVKANEYAILPATTKYMRYGADADDPWTIYWVHFSGNDMDTFNQSLHIGLHDGPHAIPFSEKSIQIWETMYESLDMKYSKENICNANFCLYQFIATFLFPELHLKKKKPFASDIITSAVQYMRKNIAQRVTVSKMASKHGVSASHFSNLFRKATGMAPMDYFIQLKIKKACELLYASKIKIKDVAQYVGYDDPYYFSRLFKKHMTLSPEQYKQMGENVSKT